MFCTLFLGTNSTAEIQMDMLDALGPFWVLCHIISRGTRLRSQKDLLSIKRRQINLHIYRYSWYGMERKADFWENSIHELRCIRSWRFLFVLCLALSSLNLGLKMIIPFSFSYLRVASENSISLTLSTSIRVLTWHNLLSHLNCMFSTRP